MLKNQSNFMKKSLKNRIALIGLFLVPFFGILLSGCAPSEEKMNEAKDLINEASKLVEEYHFSEALNKYEKARAIDTGNSDIYTGVASIYMIKNRPADAKAILQKGIDNARNKSRVNESMGDVFLQEGDIDQAIKYFRSSVSGDKDNYEASYKLAFAYVNDGEFDKAEKYLNIPDDEGDVYVEARLLESVLLGDDIENARTIMDELVDNETESESLRNRVETYDEYLERISELDEDEQSDIYVDVLLAGGALEAGYEDVAVDLLGKYAEDEEQYWEVYFYLGRAAFINAELEKSIEYLENAEVINPSDYLAPWSLARVQAEDLNESEMIKCYERAVSLSENDDKKTIRKEFAQQLVAGENYSEALLQYDALETEDPDNSSEYKVYRAEVYLMKGELDDCSTELSAVSEEELNDKELSLYYLVKATYYFETGELDIAEKWVEESININILGDTLAQSYLLFGKIMFESGDESKAEEYLDRAIDMDLEGDVTAEANKILDRI